MKVINSILLLSAVLGLTAALKCYMTVDAKEATDCKEAETKKCIKPTWVPYTGYAKGSVWGCGECDTGENAVACTTCAVDDCNKPATSTSFECFSWTYKEDKWTQEEAKATCLKSLESTKVMCNAPDRDLEGTNDSKYTIQANGCGACKAGEKDAKGCLECQSALCNGSTVISMSFLLAAASALVYLM